MRMDLAHPSLGSATNTRIDTACRHMQQCRVSYEHMINFVHGDADKLQRDKMTYCVHKDEFVMRAGCYLLEDRLQGFTRSAYPLIVSTMGTEVPSSVRFLYCLMYHHASDVHTRHVLKRVINKFVEAMEDQEERAHAVKMLFDLLPFGVSTTMAHAHHLTGDTMASVQIGGLITVTNGAFPVAAGDHVQTYWDFELPFFVPQTGRRIQQLFEIQWVADEQRFKVMSADEGTDATMSEAEFVKDLCHRYEGKLSDKEEFPNLTTKYRKQYFDREQGKKVTARLKPYKRGERFVLYDYLRVFGVAIADARAYDPVDIQICRMPLWENLE